MPKLKTKPDDRQASIIRANITYLMSLYGTKTDSVARAMGLSLSTFSRRMKNPKTMTVGELQNLAGLWHITLPQIIAERKIDY